MRELNHHLLRLMLAGMLVLGTAGLRAVHVAAAETGGGVHAACAHHHCGADTAAPRAPDSGAPAHSDDCRVCQQIDAVSGGLPNLVGAPVFHALVCVQNPHAPAFCPAPHAPSAVSARPPPSC